MPEWSLSSPQRLRALSEIDVFPGAPADAFAVYPRLVARFLDVPTALVSFVGEDCQFFPAATGLGEPWATPLGTRVSRTTRRWPNSACGPIWGCRCVPRAVRRSARCAPSTSWRERRGDRVRDVDVDLVAFCRGVASQREGGAPIRVEGVPIVVRSLKAILHHVVALLAGAFADEPLTLVVGSDAAAGRIQVRTAASPAHIPAVDAVRRLLLEQLGGRLVERPTPDVAFEVVLPC